MLVALAPIDVVAMEWPDDLSAVLVLRGRGAVIGLNRRHSPGRRHFSFWHEVGHYLLHRTRLERGPLSCSHAPHQRRLEPALEREADSFAVNLMMPAQWVRRSLEDRPSVAALARDFGVTPRAMQRRLRELGLRALAETAGP